MLNLSQDNVRLHQVIQVTFYIKGNAHISTRLLI